MKLYSVYGKTTLLTFLTSVIVLAGVYAYVFFVQPPVANAGVQELSAGVIDSESAKTSENVYTDDEKLHFVSTASTSEYIWVPMPEGVKATDVVIENHYMDAQLWIAIDCADTEFYKKESISGNLKDIAGGVISNSSGKTVLKLDMDHIYEYNTIFENGVLYIEKVAPAVMYDKIVIVDPAGNAPDNLLNAESMKPSAICLDIAAKVKNILEKKNIKVYVTSMDERVIDDQSKLFLSSEIKPDMYIRIETAYDEDTKLYGTETVYNGTYFIPGFGSVELADLLEREVTTNIGGRVGGMSEAKPEDVVIQKATVPAATVKIGYYTNLQENILLNRDDYRSKIAQGIANAVNAGFDE